MVLAKNLKAQEGPKVRGYFFRKMNETEKLLANRPDLALLWEAKEKRLQQGHYCDNCNCEFEGRPMRTEAYTSPPEEGSPPLVEVRLTCIPQCDVEMEQNG